MKVERCTFVRAAHRAEDEPKTSAPLVIFLGRSNVGKSSLINRLVGAKVARTSGTPGATQTVNFYDVDGRLGLVDLPGYGYARVPRAVRETWRPMVEGFLKRRRDQIALAVALVDARHPPSPLDLVLEDWLRSREIPRIVVATKADKLSLRERREAARALDEAYPADDGKASWWFASAETGEGTAEIWKRTAGALAAFRRTDRGRRWTSAS